jgi:O-antigen ligase
VPTARQSVAVAVGGVATSVAAGAGFALGGRSVVLPVLGLVIAVLTLFAPQAVALIGIAVLFMNLPGIAVTLYGVPPVLAACAFLLLAAPFAVRVFARGEPILIDRTFFLIIAFLGAVLLSSFVAEDQAIARTWLYTLLLEGVFVYFMTLNLFRTPDSIRRAVDVLMLCAALLGALTLYQEATRSYGQQFAGLAQRNVEFGTGETDIRESRKVFRNPNKIYLRERAGGPLGGANRYGQVLLLLLPAIYFRMRGHKKGLVKAATGVCALLILGAMLLTYSRGAFVGFVAVMLGLTVMRGIRVRGLVTFAAVAVIAVTAWAPGYVLRLATLGGITGAFEQDVQTETDTVILSRLTETLAAFNVFLDHPLIGVGPGQYTPIYSAEYMNNPDIDLRRITVDRRAHNLYFELAAETGILGIGTFLTIVLYVMTKLWRGWWRWRRTRPDLAALAGSFFLGLVGYLVTAMFLHLSYQRYYWMFLGLAGATIHVLAEERRRATAIAPGAPQPDVPVAVAVSAPAARASAKRRTGGKRRAS